MQQFLRRVERASGASSQLTPPQQSCTASTELVARLVQVGRIGPLYPPARSRRNFGRPAEPVLGVSRLLHGHNRDPVALGLLHDCYQFHPGEDSHVDGDGLEWRPLTAVAVEDSQDAPQADACRGARQSHLLDTRVEGNTKRQGLKAARQGHLLHALVAPVVPRQGQKATRQSHPFQVLVESIATRHDLKATRQGLLFNALVECIATCRSRRATRQGHLRDALTATCIGLANSIPHRRNMETDGTGAYIKWRVLERRTR